MGTEYPRTCRYQTQQARIQTSKCIPGQRYKPIKHLLTGNKLAYSYSQTCLSYLTYEMTANQVYIPPKL